MTETDSKSCIDDLEKFSKASPENQGGILSTMVPVMRNELLSSIEFEKATIKSFKEYTAIVIAQAEETLERKISTMEAQIKAHRENQPNDS